MRNQDHTGPSKKVWICAGEASGDIYGAMLVEALHQIDPDIVCAGMGGACMREQGFNALIHSEALSVMGW